MTRSGSHVTCHVTSSADAPRLHADLPPSPPDLVPALPSFFSLHLFFSAILLLLLLLPTAPIVIHDVRRPLRLPFTVTSAPISRCEPVHSFSHQFLKDNACLHSQTPSYIISSHHRSHCPHFVTSFALIFLSIVVMTLLWRKQNVESPVRLHPFGQRACSI
jgi:hypothetical protein